MFVLFGKNKQLKSGFGKGGRLIRILVEGRPAFGYKSLARPELGTVYLFYFFGPVAQWTI